MGMRFRKSIKIGKYLRLNISKSGISASIGKQGATINVGGKGTYLNLSPSLVGVKGTGVSYRQRLTGGYGNILELITGQVANKNNKKEAAKQIEDKANVELVNVDDVDKYNEILETNINLHKYADNLISEDALKKRIDDFEDAESKEVYQMAIHGDEDTIESLVGAFFNNLNLNYDVKADFELEDEILYIDLDLPEIEDFANQYPTLDKNKTVIKKKTNAMLKEEYARSVLSLSIFLAANIFNMTSYIEKIIISAYTSLRDKNGDLKDTYLYSVKYTRDIFANTDLSKIDDPYKFLLQFENRINMSANYSFKAITPYEMASIEKTNALIDEAVEGLKGLGYKAKDINVILPELKKLDLKTSGEYIKKALKMLKND